jgi:titin
LYYEDGTVQNGEIYQYRITAINALGGGVAVITDSLTPRTTAGQPGKPARDSETVEDRQVTLIWTAPGQDGGTPITDYIIEYTKNDPSLVGAIDWQTYPDSVRAVTYVTVTGLENGTQYWFRVRAKTALLGTPSVPSDGYTPLARSAAPTSIVATVPEGQSETIDLAWTAPTETGGSLLISGYSVQYSTDSGNNWDIPSGDVAVVFSGESARITGLTNGLAYAFRVAAITDAGTGWFSARSTLVVPLGLAPAPVDISNVSQSEMVTLFWGDPAGGYGGTVVDYEVEWWEVGSTTTSSSFTDGNAWFMLTGLEPASTYDFRVRARLASGVSGDWTPWYQATTSGA